MPDFTVIAGPNGAGKSTFSKLLSPSGACIFDPDKQKALIESQYPDISDEATGISVTLAYQAHEKEALIKKKSLTVETNLRNQFFADRAEYLRNFGYQTNLIFILLPDIAYSADRVNLRVRNHGHFVDMASIKENFQESLLNMRLVALRFQNIMLLSGANEMEKITIPHMLLLAKSGKVMYLNSEVPIWAENLVSEIISTIRPAKG